ncbi:MAG TPA: phosphoglucosamine mutase [Clostridiaceae bacterium]|nr:phosphoglucosamine mutase [Clostridiaceae bacterium]
MGKLFGTDGVRGVANQELTPMLAYQLGQGGAFVLTSETNHTPKILVGMDTRISGHMLEAALIAGICSVGAEAVCLGVLPTPAVAYLTKLYGADAGVVISASHNPYEFNGIKFFNNKGYKLSDEIEEKIEDLILNKSEEIPLALGSKIGRKSIEHNALNDYINFLKNTIDCDLTGIKIALDCANGASYIAAPTVLSQLGAEIYVINNQPDGININYKCGSTNTDELCKLVLETGADVGLAFDGDADRLMAVDEKGNVVNGDQIMAILGLYLKRCGRLNRNTIVATVMSNLGLDLMAKASGIDLVRTKVGDRYVLEEMLSSGYCLGGEQSGHIIFLEHSSTGDGIITGLQLLKVMKNSGQKLSELSSVMKVLPQVLRNARVKNSNKHKYMDDEVIAAKCRELEDEFNGEGRVLIRPSGTEPLIRVMIEGKDSEYLSSRADELIKIIEERLG